MKKYTSHRTNKIVFHPGTCGFRQAMIHRTGDELAWREFMKRVHGGFVVFVDHLGRQLVGEHLLGRDQSWKLEFRNK